MFLLEIIIASTRARGNHRCRFCRNYYRHRCGVISTIVPRLLLLVNNKWPDWLLFSPRGIIAVACFLITAIISIHNDKYDQIIAINQTYLDSRT